MHGGTVDRFGIVFGLIGLLWGCQQEAAPGPVDQDGDGWEVGEDCDYLYIGSRPTSSDNPSLADLQGLHGLTTVSGVIVSGSVLPCDEASALADAIDSYSSFSTTDCVQD